MEEDSEKVRKGRSDESGQQVGQAEAKLTQGRSFDNHGGKTQT